MLLFVHVKYNKYTISSTMQQSSHSLIKILIYYQAQRAFFPLNIKNKFTMNENNLKGFAEIDFLYCENMSLLLELRINQI